jgi:hypothetical protein
MADNRNWLALVSQALKLSSKKCLAWGLLLALMRRTEISLFLILQALKVSSMNYLVSLPHTQGWGQ